MALVTQPVASAGERSPDQAKNPDAAEVEELKRRLAELETLVSGLAPKKAARKKKQPLYWQRITRLPKVPLRFPFRHQYTDWQHHAPFFFAAGHGSK